MEFDLDQLVRENIRTLVPYSSARGEFCGDAQIFLDANENSFGSPLAQDHSLYPDPLQRAVKARIAEMNGIEPSQIFVGNGSDEAIDILFRIFCRPGVDEVLICPPTYGMYETAANINDIAIIRTCLTDEFELDLDRIQSSIGERTKLIFICSPNNPTGNSMSRETILEIVGSFRGIVVVDEAYIQFSENDSLVPEIDSFPNLVVLRTFSKAWGLAGLRVGIAFANERIIALFNKVKPPYNVSQTGQEIVLEALNYQDRVARTIALIVKERENLVRSLQQFSFVVTAFRSDANFLLVKTTNPKTICEFLRSEQIIVRNRSNVELCEGCLRITVGTAEENRSLLAALEKYEKSVIH